MYSLAFYVMAGFSCYEAMKKSSRITTILGSKEIFWLETITS